MLGSLHLEAPVLDFKAYWNTTMEPSTRRYRLRNAESMGEVWTVKNACTEESQMAILAKTGWLGRSDRRRRVSRAVSSEL